MPLKVNEISLVTHNNTNVKQSCPHTGIIYKIALIITIGCLLYNESTFKCQVMLVPNTKLIN